jgi:hypothetical protein
LTRGWPATRLDVRATGPVAGAGARELTAAGWAAVGDGGPALAF